jgi:hypothetical protein
MEYDAKQPVYLPVADFLNLELHLLETRPGMKPDALITELVKRWLAGEAELQPLGKEGPAMRGFQWKSLFLPDGTTLRTGHANTVEFAKVVGDRIVADDGARLTPSLFANRHATGRNAWRFVWLRFPGENHWHRADDCRARTGDPVRDRSKTTEVQYKTV